MKGAKIYYTQVAVMSALLIYATGFLALPRILAQTAGNAAWLAGVGGTLIGIGLAWAVGTLASHHPDLGFTGMAEKTYGLIIGKIIGFSFVVYSIILLSIATRQFSFALAEPFLRRTPPTLVLGVFFLLIIYSTYLGIQSVARVSLIFFAIGALSVIGLVALSYPVLHPGWLLPIIGPGPAKIARGSLDASSYFAEIILMLAVVRYMRRKKTITRALITGVLIAGAVIVSISAFGIAMFGPRAITRFVFPVVEMAGAVGIGEFLDRAEFLYLVLWFNGAILKLAIVFYAAASSLSDALNLKDYRPVVVPLAVLSMGLTMIPENVEESIYAVDLFKTYSIWYAVALLAIMLVGDAVMRRIRKGDRADAS